MPEERVCFICGRANARNSRVCAHCAASYDMERPFAPDEPAAAAALQLKTEPQPAPTRVPLPPQLRTVEEKKQRPTPEPKVAPVTARARTAEAAARRELQAVTNPVGLLEEETVKSAPATLKATTLSCHSCGEETNAAFSFCTHCGADLPTMTGHSRPQTQARTAPRAADLPQGVRDTRAAMRRIAEVHRQQEQVREQTQTQQRQTTEAIVIETKREVNPTLNAILSFFFPGVGQMLNGQVGKGVLLLVGSIIAVRLTGLTAYGLPMLIAGVLAAVDAYRIGERRRKGERIEPGEWDFS